MTLQERREVTDPTPPADVAIERRGAVRRRVTIDAQLFFAGRQMCDARVIGMASDAVPGRTASPSEAQASAGDAGARALGFTLIAPVSVPSGTACLLSLWLADRRGELAPLDLQATAVHCRFDATGGGFRVGLRLAGVSPAVALRLEKVLQAG